MIPPLETVFDTNFFGGLLVGIPLTLVFLLKFNMLKGH